MYRPTTEEDPDPDPARGPRSGLAAYCNLGRLRLPRRVLKGLQLVGPGPGGRAGRGRLGPGPSACGLGRRSRLSSTWWLRRRPFPPPVPSAATPPAGRPLVPRRVPDGDAGPLNDLGASRKELILIGSILTAYKTSAILICCPLFNLFSVAFFFFFFLIRNSKARVKFFTTLLLVEQTLVGYVQNRIQLETLAIDLTRTDGPCSRLRLPSRCGSSALSPRGPVFRLRSAFYLSLVLAVFLGRPGVS